MAMVHITKLIHHQKEMKKQRDRHRMTSHQKPDVSSSNHDEKASQHLRNTGGDYKKSHVFQQSGYDKMRSREGKQSQKGSRKTSQDERSGNT